MSAEFHLPSLLLRQCMWELSGLDLMMEIAMSDQ